MESTEALTHTLAPSVGVVPFWLETLSVVCVLVGLVQTVRLALSQRRRNRGADFPFVLGADIVATTTAPSDANLIRLALLAAIRTFLTIILTREMEQQQRLEERSHPETALPPLR